MVVGRKQCQAGTPCQPMDLAQALHCLVQHGALAVDALVGALAQQFDVHVTRSQMYEWSNPYTSPRELSMPLRVLRAVQIIQRSPAVLEQLGSDIGHRVEPLAPLAPTVARVRDEALDVQGAVGRASDHVRQITADGVITDAERAAARPVLRDVKQQVAELEAALEATERTA